MSVVEETYKKMEETINDIKEFANKKISEVDEPTKEKINKLVESTTKVIEEAKTKVQEVATSIVDEEKFNEFSNKVMVKVQEAADYTKSKISAITPEKEKIDKIEKEISESFDNFIDNDNVQSVIKGFQNISDGIQEYLNKPETKARINKAKKVTLAAAEKGMEKLRSVLTVEEEPTEEPKEEVQQ